MNDAEEKFIRKIISQNKILQKKITQMKNPSDYCVSIMITDVTAIHGYQIMI